MSAGALPRRALAAFGALFLAAIVSGFALGAADGSAADPLPAGYPAALVEAAGALEAATAPGGVGYTFEAVQRQVVRRKADGPGVPVTDPADPQLVVGHVEALYVSGTTSRGARTPAAFWMAMRAGPGENAAPDFDRGSLLAAVLERDGRLWRTDGPGWFETDVSPGQGMDPLTAARLPYLLRRLGSPTDIGLETIGGQALHHYAGVAAAADYPGVVASDGLVFTSSPVAVELWLDAANRLVTLRGQALNLNETGFELVVASSVTFGYGAPGAPPDPVPTLAPPPVPATAPGDSPATSPAA